MFDMRRSTLIIILSFIVGNTAMAKSPSIKPDWNNITKYSINLSGREVSYELPGNLSTEFPQIIGNDSNIYDSELYGDMRLFVVANSFWHYKSRSWFFLDKLGTLEFRIAIYKTLDEFSEDVRDSGVLQKVIQNFSNASNSNAKSVLKTDFRIVVIGENNWLFYVRKNRPSNPDYYNYLLPLTENRYLEISFNMMIGNDENRDNWYEISKSDIEKIINTFRVTFPQ